MPASGLAEPAGELVAPHLRPAGQVALLGQLVELAPGSGCGGAGSLALGHGDGVGHPPGPLGQEGLCAQELPWLIGGR